MKQSASMENQKFSIIERIFSFRYAYSGLKYLIRFEHNSRIHFVATLLVIITGFLLKISITDWALLAIAIGIVWLAEIFNTTIEILVDFISPGYDKKAGVIKDLAASGVLIAAIVAFAIGCIIFLPKLWRMIL